VPLTAHSKFFLVQMLALCHKAGDFSVPLSYALLCDCFWLS